MKSTRKYGQYWFYYSHMCDVRSMESSTCYSEMDIFGRGMRTPCNTNTKNLLTFTKVSLSSCLAARGEKFPPHTVR